MKKSKSGFANMSYSEIMMQQALQASTNPVYCRYCGKDVSRPSDKQSQTTWNQDLEWEKKYQAHMSCHRAHVIKGRGRL